MRQTERAGHSGIDAALAQATATILRSQARRRQLRQWRPGLPRPTTVTKTLSGTVFEPHRTVPIRHDDVWWLLHTMASHPVQAQDDDHTRCRSLAAAAPARLERALAAPAGIGALHAAIGAAIACAERDQASVCIGLLWHDIRHLRYNMTPLRGGGPTRATAVIERWRLDLDNERTDREPDLRNT